MTKRALITGITGQDGSYLAEFLLEKGYEVHGIKRRASSFNTQRVDHLYQDPHDSGARFHLHYGDLTDTSNLTRIIAEVQPSPTRAARWQPRSCRAANACPPIRRPASSTRARTLSR